MKLIRNIYKGLLRKFYATSRIYINSNNFYIHNSAFLEVFDKSKLVFSGSFSINKYVNIFLNEGSELTLGEHVYIGDYSTIRATRTSVFIGDHTIVGQDVKILATNHAFINRDQLIHEQDIDLVKIGVHIGRDCWLGAGSIILPGVTLGNGVVVGAGAVVTKSFPDYSVVVGNPAKVIKIRN